MNEMLLNTTQTQLDALETRLDDVEDIANSADASATSLQSTKVNVGDAVTPDGVR